MKYVIMRACTILCLWIMAVWPLPAWSQTLRWWGQSFAISELPAHVIASPGKGTLFADHAQGDDKGTPLYVINRTSTTLQIPSDTRSYLKLEVKQADGYWARAESHPYSDCGVVTSYRDDGVHLFPGHYVRMTGYRPKQAEKGMVRYRSHKNFDWISNEGEGPYLESDVAVCRYDQMSLWEVPRTLAGFIDLRESRALQEDVPWNTKVEAMRLLHVLGGVPAARRECERMVASLELHTNSDEERRASEALQKLLKLPWARELDKPRLLQACVESLEAGAGERELYWDTLCNMAELEFGFPGQYRQNHVVDMGGGVDRRVIDAVAEAG